jgi:phosphate transport system protein
MERHFDELLNELKHALFKMSALALTMIDDSIRGLVDKDEKAITSVYEKEEQVNQLQVEIDEMCLTMIALQQPMASDLRFILGAAKTNSDLERLADQAVNITNKAEKMLHDTPLQPFVIIPAMAALASRMVHDSLHAYVNRDCATARDVLMRDDELDDMKIKVTEIMLGYMAKDPATIAQALALILIARNLERIGDHATNIAENIIFVVEGRDVRHHGKPKPIT